MCVPPRVTDWPSKSTPCLRTLTIPHQYLYFKRFEIVVCVLFLKNDCKNCNFEGKFCFQNIYPIHKIGIFCRIEFETRDPRVNEGLFLAANHDAV